MTDDEYEQLVEGSATIRVELDEVLHPMFGKLKGAFKAAYGLDGKWLKLLSDLVYYQGGYPSENSPPKEEDLADRVSMALKLEDAVNRSDLKRLLAERGVKVEIDQPIEKGPMFDACVEEAREQWKGTGIAGEMPLDRGELLDALLARSQKLQGEICRQADLIKVDAADEAEKERGIKKKNFVKTVKLAAIEMRRDAEKMLEALAKIREDSENFNEAVRPLEKQE
jgi:hypothetical protein